MLNVNNCGWHSWSGSHRENIIAVNMLRALHSAVRALPRIFTPAIATTYGGGGGAGVRCLTTTLSLRQKESARVMPDAGVAELSGCAKGVKEVQVQWSDGERCSFPYVWLRENCQCPDCFNSSAIARLYLIDDLSMGIQPKHVEVDDGYLVVVWQDGHTSRYPATWLSKRAFTQAARKRQRSRYRLNRVLWGSEFKVPEVDYRSAMEDDAALLEWTVLMERYGVTKVNNAPAQVGVVIHFINHIGFLKPTHYGRHYDIITSFGQDAINLAYTGSKLGLHTDLPYTQDAPGTTWLHCIRQHEGKGGENDITDGVAGAEELRKRYPQHFETLVKTPIYFQDKGYHLYQFDKIARHASIQLSPTGEVDQIYISSQSRDSIMDLDADHVYRFYDALKTLSDIFREHSIQVKMRPGEIIVLDNTRILHGRQPFELSSSSGTRHLHNAYVDMDEIRSKRRVLQDKLGVTLT